MFTSIFTYYSNRFNHTYSTSLPETYPCSCPHDYISLTTSDHSSRYITYTYSSPHYWYPIPVYLQAVKDQITHTTLYHSHISTLNHAGKEDRPYPHSIGYRLKSLMKAVFHLHSSILSDLQLHHYLSTSIITH